MVRSSGEERGCINYNKDEFFALIEAVERQGGTHLDSMCTGHHYVCDSGDKAVEVTLPGCGSVAMFEIPYDSHIAGESFRTITACAVDDDMGRWPRFMEPAGGE